MLNRRYLQSMQELKAMISHEYIAPSGDLVRIHCFVVMIDNYANTKYAAESKSILIKDSDGVVHLKSIKAFAGTTDPLAGQCIGFRRSTYLSDDPQSIRSAVDLQIEGFYDKLISTLINYTGTLDLKGSMSDDHGQNIQSKCFPHLADFTPLASLKAKSSSHFSIA
jgi:hypothetical protein